MPEKTLEQIFLKSRCERTGPWKLLIFNRPHAATGEAARVEALVGKVTPESLLRGNELVILMVRPSLWYIAATSFRFCGIIILLALLTIHSGIFGDLLWPKTALIISGALVGMRIIYALMEWTSHLYLLTTCRIVTIKGARHPTIFEAGLAHISEARLIEPAMQNMLALGTIGFAVDKNIDPGSLWEWIPNAPRIHQQILAAISKRKGQ